MAQYINKSALVAEIEKGINGRNDWQLDEYRKGYHDALTMLKKYLSTFEVKEVDLDLEISTYMDNEMKFLSDEVGYDTLSTIAKHFFELGLKARKGE